MPATLTLRPNVQGDTDNPVAANLDCRRTTADYYAAITALDAQLGRLLEKLDELGLAGDTVVIFTSDHGDMLWSHGLLKKQAPFEEAINVPFLIRWPRALPAGETRGLLLSTVDILPTLAGLSGLPLPAQVEGRDLSAALVGAVADVPGAFIANLVSSDEGARQNISEWRGVRGRRYTYVEQVGREPWLFFDNEADPFQLHNLVGHPAVRSLQGEYRAHLTEHLEATRDPFVSGARMLEHFGLTDAWAERERNRDG